MSELKIVGKMFLLMMGAVATTYMTIAMILVSKGAKEVCFNESRLWISIPEFIIGIFTIILLCYYCVLEGIKLTNNKKEVSGHRNENTRYTKI